MNKPTEAIDITRWMIDAGVAALNDSIFDGKLEDASDKIVKEIFYAMNNICALHKICILKPELVNDIAVLISQWESSDELSLDFSKRLLSFILATMFGQDQSNDLWISFFNSMINRIEEK